MLPNPFAYRFTSPLFHFTGAASLRTSIDGCITGEDQRAVSDGYYVILRPLDPGRHNVVFTARDTHGHHNGDLPPQRQIGVRRFAARSGARSSERAIRRAASASSRSSW